MLSNKDQGHLKRVKKVAYKLNLPEEAIEETLFYMSEYIKKKISEVVVSNDIMMTKEEFEERLPIIKIPHMGYMRPSYYKYKHIHIKSKEKRERELKEKLNS